MAKNTATILEDNNAETVWDLAYQASPALPPQTAAALRVASVNIDLAIEALSKGHLAAFAEACRMAAADADNFQTFMRAGV